jgi:hypothetical protein
MNIHQLSVNYVQEHDRVLVRINTLASEELRLWFTRRLTLGFLPLLSKVVAEQVAKTERVKSPYIAAADEQSQQILADFKKVESLQGSDFATPYKERPSALPLGAEPLLVTEINLTPLSNGQLQFVFSEKLSDASATDAKPRSFQMALEPKLTHGLMHLLEKAFEVSQWTMVSTGHPQPSDALPGERTMEKPKYLN